jgi:glyoxylase-like metal-dependent hydrolase (beta-lactamase superfamily II)
MLKVEQFVCGPLQNNVYVFSSDSGGDCAIVDPAIDSAPALAYINAQGLKPRYILLTHAHFDHVFGLAEVKRQLDAPIALHADDLPMLKQMPDIAASWGFAGAPAPPQPEILVEHGQQLDLGDSRIEVRHTPGHSPGQVAYIIGGHAFVGDTLFWRGIGRYDLPGADYHALMRSIQEQLYTLPGETIVWPGHGQHTTIDEERRLNPYIGEGARFAPQL